MAKKSIIKSGPRYYWKDSDKSRAVATYVSVGSFTKSAAITGIPENTIRLWAKQDWWAEEALRVNRSDSDELKSSFTRIAKRATTELEDRLDNGDEILTKDGTVVKKKIAGRDLAIIAAVAADKRKMQLEEPNLVPLQNTQEKLAALMEDFLKFARAKTIHTEVVDAEFQELRPQLHAGTANGDPRPPEGESGEAPSEVRDDQGRQSQGG